MRRLMFATCVALLFSTACKGSSDKTEVPDSTEPTTALSTTNAASDDGSGDDDETSDAGSEMPTDLGPPRAGSGKEVYERVCVTCHGKTGDGRGLEQKLFGFDAPAEKWTNGPTVEGILETLRQGVHDSSMAPFPAYGEPERRAVAVYVLQLRDELLGQETDATP